MAYLNYLASVSAEQIDLYRRGAIDLIQSTFLIEVSHGIPSWCSEREIREVVEDVLDGGESLRSDLTHPLRVPCFHRKEKASTLFKKLKNVEKQVISTGWMGDLSPIYAVLSHASQHAECLLSVLEQPDDLVQDRLPISTPSKKGDV